MPPKDPLRTFGELDELQQKYLKEELLPYTHEQKVYLREETESVLVRIGELILENEQDIKTIKDFIESGSVDSADVKTDQLIERIKEGHAFLSVGDRTGRFGSHQDARTLSWRILPGVVNSTRILFDTIKKIENAYRKANLRSFETNILSSNRSLTFIVSAITTWRDRHYAIEDVWQLNTRSSTAKALTFVRHRIKGEEKSGELKALMSLRAKRTTQRQTDCSQTPPVEEYKNAGIPKERRDTKKYIEEPPDSLGVYPDRDNRGDSDNLRHDQDALGAEHNTLDVCSQRGEDKRGTENKREGGGCLREPEQEAEMGARHPLSPQKIFPNSLPTDESTSHVQNDTPLTESIGVSQSQPSDEIWPPDANLLGPISGCPAERITGPPVLGPCTSLHDDYQCAQMADAQCARLTEKEGLSNGIPKQTRKGNRDNIYPDSNRSDLRSGGLPSVYDSQDSNRVKDSLHLRQLMEDYPDVSELQEKKEDLDGPSEHIEGFDNDIDAPEYIDSGDIDICGSGLDLENMEACEPLDEVKENIEDKTTPPSKISGKNSPNFQTMFPCCICGGLISAQSIDDLPDDDDRINVLASGIIVCSLDCLDEYLTQKAQAVDVEKLESPLSKPKETPMDYLKFADPYNPTNPMARKGRVVPPILLKGFPHLMLHDNRRTIGIDVAWYGDDQTCLAFREGMHVVDVQRYSKQDTAQTVGVAVGAVLEFEPEEVIIDVTGGFGANVYDGLKRQGLGLRCRITAVAFNGDPRSARWKAANKRTEMYLIFQELMMKGLVSLPPDEGLVKALQYVRYTIDSDGGKIRISPKVEIKKELGRSPDDADAVVMSFYSRPALRIF
jgi:hypothetical protein